MGNGTLAVLTLVGLGLSAYTAWNSRKMVRVVDQFSWLNTIPAGSAGPKINAGSAAGQNTAQGLAETFGAMFGL